MKKIVLRPSAIDTASNCPQQWYRTHILGQNSIPNARASIGTAIHRAAEVLWTEAIATGKKDVNLAKATDAALECFKEEAKQGLQFKDGENVNTANVEVIKGTEAFVTDIVPFTDIPQAVEKRFTIPLDGHPVVESVSGTVDYISHNQISDIKTSSRKPTVSNYITQQSTYKLLAEKNGVDVQYNTIQSVVFAKKETAGHILEMPTDVEQAKLAINTLLDVTEIYAKDIVDPNILFRGNPKYYLCSEMYCAFYNDCPFIAGTAKKATPNDIATVKKAQPNMVTL